MGKSKDLASGNSAAYVETAGDTMTGNLAINNASGSQVTLHRSDTTIVNDDLVGQIIMSGDDADTDASGTRGFIRGRSQGTGGGLKMEFGTAGGGVVIGDPRMTINADGYVTTPNQPQFVLQGSFNNFTTITQAGAWLPFTGATGNAQSSGGVIAMNWTSSRSGGYNPTGNGFNATTGVYTAPVTGTYMFTFNAYLNKPSHSGGEYVHINSYINGANQDDYTIYGYAAALGSYQSPEITKVIRMATNDTFGFRLYSNVASSFKIYPHYTCIAGYLLG